MIPLARRTRRLRRLALGLLLAVGAVAIAGAPTRSPAALAEWPAHVASPTFDLLDEAGQPRTPADYRGRPFVVLFGFARCPDICPAELFKLSRAIKALGPPGAEVQVLFVTVDPTHDSPQDLHAFVTAFDPRFAALTGSEAQVAAATNSFHIEYAHVAQAGGDTITHSSPVYLFDRQARLRRIGAANTPVSGYTRALSALLGE